MKSTAEDLIHELVTAERFVRLHQLTNWAGALQTYQEFMRQQEFARLKYLWRVFAPTCAWDDLSATLSPADAQQATRIGEAVFQAVEHLRIELGMEPRSWTYDDPPAPKQSNVA